MAKEPLCIGGETEADADGVGWRICGWKGVDC